ncbi:hypothetical protein Bca52824_013843 [Brassica carinata]|uniref:Uncharacterized protein n=1 Tax=Brassica carinata TaxID=52824 RepID=A0A8X7W168_BRACI|nr:hypothetical protein Bca52824_013843 [Brassica carinata]
MRPICRPATPPSTLKSACSASGMPEMSAVVENKSGVVLTNWRSVCTDSGNPERKRAYGADMVFLDEKFGHSLRPLTVLLTPTV